VVSAALESLVATNDVVVSEVVVGSPVLVSWVASVGAELHPRPDATTTREMMQRHVRTMSRPADVIMPCLSSAVGAVPDPDDVRARPLALRGPMWNAPGS
jgi:hypothetical protein